MRNLSIRVKLLLAFLALAAIIAGVGVYQILSMRHFTDLFTNLTDQNLRRLYALENIELSAVKLRDARSVYQQDLLPGIASQQIIATQKAIVADQAADLHTKIDEYVQLTNIDNPYVSPKIVSEVESSGKDVLSETNTILSSGSTTQIQDALRISQTHLDQAITSATDGDRSGIQFESAQISDIVAKVLTAIVALVVFSTFAALVTGALLASWLARALAQLRLSAERISNGDFSHIVPVTSGDELGQLGNAFNRMAERLRDSYRRIALGRERDEAMFQSMGEGFVALDKQGNIELINSVAATLLGFGAPGEAVGHRVGEAYQLYAADDTTHTPLPLEKRPAYITLQTGETVSGVYKFEGQDGRKFLMSMIASPVKVEDKVEGAVAILRDVTKEKEIDRMKTEFISLASHQLRTPLSAIKWFTEMLVSGDAGKLQPDQQEFAKNISDSTERMIALVNALLNISRIESGRIMIDPKPTDLGELVSGIVNDLKGKTEEKKQTLIISVHQDLPKINLDPRLIGQVYLNLLTNAIKYTPKGGEISVFISKKDDQVVSQVTDSGYGIPKEQQGRIFQKFFRASNAVKVETDGTGLGLYLIKAVIESSGGKIWFQSEEGKGTTFWFSIPLSGMKAKEGEVTLDA